MRTIIGIFFLNLNFVTIFIIKSMDKKPYNEQIMQIAVFPQNQVETNRANVAKLVCCKFCPTSHPDLNELEMHLKTQKHRISVSGFLVQNGWTNSKLLDVLINEEECKKLQQAYNERYGQHE